VWLSPAGDGAEDAEETCEEQKWSTWWMVVLVGGSGQGLFTWETRSSRSVTSSWCQGRVQEGARPGTLSAAAKHLHSDCTAVGDAHTTPEAACSSLCRRRLQAFYGSSAQAGRAAAAVGRAGGARETLRAPPPAESAPRPAFTANDVRAFKAPIAH
jgi:hypothetical protein